jgi:hypothetical protein
MSMDVESKVYCHGVFEIEVLDCHSIGVEQWFFVLMSTRPELSPRDGISPEVRWLMQKLARTRAKKIMWPNFDGTGT